MPELGEIFIQKTWRGFGRAVLFLKHRTLEVFDCLMEGTI